MMGWAMSIRVYLGLQQRDVEFLANWPKRSSVRLLNIGSGRYFWSLLFCLSALGCSDDRLQVHVVPVTGKVLVDGQNAEGAFVAFHPVNGSESPLHPTAQVAADGSFKLTTVQSGDGAPPGDYNVTIKWHKLEQVGGEYRPGPNLLPARFAKPKVTPLRVRVADQATTLPPFKLKS